MKNDPLEMNNLAAERPEVVAELTGAYIREAADAYRDTGLLKTDDE